MNDDSATNMFCCSHGSRVSPEPHETNNNLSCGTLILWNLFFSREFRETVSLVLTGKLRQGTS